LNHRGPAREVQAHRHQARGIQMIDIATVIVMAISYGSTAYWWIRLLQDGCGLRFFPSTILSDIAALASSIAFAMEGWS